MLADAREGLSFVIRNRYLRPISICTGTSNFFWSMGGAILVVYAVRELEMSPAALGIAFSIGNVGALVAAVTTSRISNRLGVGPTILTMSMVFSGAMVLVPLATPETAVVLLAALGRDRRVRRRRLQHHAAQLPPGDLPATHAGPDERGHPLPRLGHDAARRALGGALGTWIGLRPALWVAAIGAFFTFLPILFSPVPKLREMPTQVEEPLPSEAEAAGGCGRSTGVPPQLPLERVTSVGPSGRDGRGVCTT